MRTITILFMLISFSVFSQVGINTTSPQQMLHVAGANETIRIDGLNSVNNVSNNGFSTPVSVNTNGDFILSPTTKFTLDESDFIITPTFISSSTGAIASNNALGTTTINLSKPSLVCLNYNITLSNISTSLGGNITDGSPRIFFAYISVNGNNYAIRSASYSNSATTGTIPSGFFYLGGTHYMNLSAGTHTINLGGGVFGGSRSVRAEFGVGNDSLQVLILD